LTHHLHKLINLASHDFGDSSQFIQPRLSMVIDSESPGEWSRSPPSLREEWSEPSSTERLVFKSRLLI
jgi:hypothetical protein